MICGKVVVIIVLGAEELNSGHPYWVSRNGSDPSAGVS